ncbi:chromatin modification- protein VID21 [Dimargaris cristalligena]|nr:chromatin modification- protein VID21 [Dimargaris cristalligena]
MNTTEPHSPSDLDNCQKPNDILDQNYEQLFQEELSHILTEYENTLLELYYWTSKKSSIHPNTPTSSDTLPHHPDLSQLDWCQIRESPEFSQFLTSHQLPSNPTDSMSVVQNVETNSEGSINNVHGSRSPSHESRIIKSLPIARHRQKQSANRKTRIIQFGRRKTKSSRKNANHQSLELYGWLYKVQHQPLFKSLQSARKFLTTNHWKVARDELKAFRTLQRIEALKSQNLWSFRQIERHEAPPRTKSHWDFLLDEMQWLQADFKEERKLKIALSHQIGTWVMAWHRATDKSALCVRTRPRPALITTISSSGGAMDTDPLVPSVDSPTVPVIDQSPASANGALTPKVAWPELLDPNSSLLLNDTLSQELLAQFYEYPLMVPPVFSDSAVFEDILEHSQMVPLSNLMSSLVAFNEVAQRSEADDQGLQLVPQKRSGELLEHFLEELDRQSQAFLDDTELYLPATNAQEEADIQANGSDYVTAEDRTSSFTMSGFDGGYTGDHALYRPRKICRTLPGAQLYDDHQTLSPLFHHKSGSQDGGGGAHFPSPAMLHHIPPPESASAGPITWTPEDDTLLQDLVESYGSHWSLVADAFNTRNHLPGAKPRNGRDCFDRWAALGKQFPHMPNALDFNFASVASTPLSATFGFTGDNTAQRGNPATSFSGQEGSGGGKPASTTATVATAGDLATILTAEEKRGQRLQSLSEAMRKTLKKRQDIQSRTEQTLALRSKKVSAFEAAVDASAILAASGHGPSNGKTPRDANTPATNDTSGTTPAVSSAPTQGVNKASGDNTAKADPTGSGADDTTTTASGAAHNNNSNSAGAVATNNKPPGGPPSVVYRSPMELSSAKQELDIQMAQMALRRQRSFTTSQWAMQNLARTMTGRGGVPALPMGRPMGLPVRPPPGNNGVGGEAGAATGGGGGAAGGNPAMAAAAAGAHTPAQHPGLPNNPNLALLGHPNGAPNPNGLTPAQAAALAASMNAMAAANGGVPMNPGMGRGIPRIPGVPPGLAARLGPEQMQAFLAARQAHVFRQAMAAQAAAASAGSGAPPGNTPNFPMGPGGMMSLPPQAQVLHPSHPPQAAVLATPPLGGGGGGGVSNTQGQRPPGSDGNGGGGPATGTPPLRPTGSPRTPHQAAKAATSPSTTKPGGHPMGGPNAASLVLPNSATGQGPPQSQGGGGLHKPGAPAAGPPQGMPGQAVGVGGIPKPQFKPEMNMPFAMGGGNPTMANNLSALAVQFANLSPAQKLQLLQQQQHVQHLHQQYQQVMIQQQQFQQLQQHHQQQQHQQQQQQLQFQAGLSPDDLQKLQSQQLAQVHLRQQLQRAQLLQQRNQQQQQQQQHQQQLLQQQQNLKNSPSRPVPGSEGAISAQMDSSNPANIQPMVQSSPNPGDPTGGSPALAAHTGAALSTAPQHINQLLAAKLNIANISSADFMAAFEKHKQQHQGFNAEKLRLQLLQHHLAAAAQAQNGNKNASVAAAAAATGGVSPNLGNMAGVRPNGGSPSPLMSPMSNNTAASAHSPHHHTPRPGMGPMSLNMGGGHSPGGTRLRPPPPPPPAMMGSPPLGMGPGNMRALPGHPFPISSPSVPVPPQSQPPSAAGHHPLGVGPNLVGHPGTPPVRPHNSLIGTGSPPAHLQLNPAMYMGTPGAGGGGGGGTPGVPMGLNMGNNRPPLNYSAAALQASLMNQGNNTLMAQALNAQRAAALAAAGAGAGAGAGSPGSNPMGPNGLLLPNMPPNMASMNPNALAAMAAAMAAASGNRIPPGQPHSSASSSPLPPTNMLAGNGPGSPGIGGLGVGVGVAGLSNPDSVANSPNPNNAGTTVSSPGMPPTSATASATVRASASPSGLLAHRTPNAGTKSNGLGNNHSPLLGAAANHALRNATGQLSNQNSPVMGNLRPTGPGTGGGGVHAAQAALTSAHSSPNPNAISNHATPNPFTAANPDNSTPGSSG